MLILFGTHRFNTRKIYARKDFCNACKSECLTEQFASFDCGHLFFIPLLPLGKRRRWRCSRCGKDPQARYETSKPLRIIGLFILPIFVGIPLLVHDDHPPRDPGEAYGPYIMAAAFGSAWLYLVYTTFFKKPSGINNEERRASVTPLATNICLYCRGPLATHPSCHCPACGVQFDAVPISGPPPLPR
jgi:hypothetical protein